MKAPAMAACIVIQCGVVVKRALMPHSARFRSHAIYSTESAGRSYAASAGTSPMAASRLGHAAQRRDLHRPVQRQIQAEPDRHDPDWEVGNAAGCGGYYRVP